MPLGGVDADLLEQRVHAEGPGLVRDDRDDLAADLRVADEVRSSRANTIVVDTPVVLPPLNSASTGVPGRAGRAPGPRAAARDRRGSPALEHVPDLVGVRARVEVRGVAELVVGIGSSRRSRNTRSSSSLSFLAWWVMFRASTPRPRVQPLTVLARMTVGAPVNSVAAL